MGTGGTLYKVRTNLYTPTYENVPTHLNGWQVENCCSDKSVLTQAGNQWQNLILSFSLTFERIANTNEVTQDARIQL